MPTGKKRSASDELEDSRPTKKLATEAQVVKKDWSLEKLQVLPLQTRELIGSFVHQVPEASSSCKVLLKLQGKDNNYIANRRSYNHLSEQAKTVYDACALACAVTRKLLVHGRGNVTQDILKSQGKSSAGLTRTRDGFADQPTFQFTNPNGDDCQININGKDVTELTDLELSALRAIYSKAGNCNEHADVGYAFLKTQKLPNGTQIYHCTNSADDHVFLIAIVPDNKGDSTVLICDPWINFYGTVNQAKQPDINSLVNFKIYQPALELAKKCFATAKSQLTIKDDDGEEKYSVEQPEVSQNIFGLPAIKETVGTLAEDYNFNSEFMQEKATKAVETAQSDIQKSQQNKDTQYYVMPQHEFETGDAVKIPTVSFKK